MSSKQRKPIHPILETMVDLAQRRLEAGPVVTPSEVTALREALRDRLVRARRELGHSMTERDSYLLLFPLVVHLDELVQAMVPDDSQAQWELLQRDLFDTEKGGELFYKALDELLETEQANPLVYEIYAFCLNLGFRGRYIGNEEKVAEYSTALAARLPDPPADADEEASKEASKDDGRFRRATSPLWYYAAAFGLVAGAWVAIDMYVAETLLR